MKLIFIQANVIILTQHYQAAFAFSPEKVQIKTPAVSEKRIDSSSSRRREFIASSFLASVSLVSSSTPSNAQSTIPSSSKLEQIQQIYDSTASSYEEKYSESFISKKLDFDTLRQNLLSQAKGNVLELGVGTGLNLPHYPNNDQIKSYTAVDISPKMLEQAKIRFDSRDKGVSETLLNLYKQDKVRFEIADVGKLTSVFESKNEEGEDGTKFDTIIDTFGLCVFPEPLEVLKQSRELLSPNGQLLLLEHQDSTVAKILSPTRNLSDVSKTCRYDDDVRKLLKSAGFSDVEYVDLAAGFLINVIAKK